MTGNTPSGATAATPVETAIRTLVVVCTDWPVRAAGYAGDDRPVAVWSHRGIVATNPAARADGVRIGLRRREAQRRCPELTLIAADPARDARAFDPVVAALGAFTPWVEIVEPGVAAFGTRGPSRYFGGDVALAELARDRVAELFEGRAAVRIGVADGPLVARLAALAPPLTSSAPAPGTIRIVDPGAAPAFVATIPLSVIGRFVPDPGIIAVCERLGLHTLGQVAALPARSFLGRFGNDGALLHRLARGADPTASSPVPVPPGLDETVDFDPPEVRADAVAFAARSGAEVFVDRLARSGLSCAQVVVTLSTDHAEQLQRRWRLDGPERYGERTRSVAQLVAERVRWQTDGWLAGSARSRPSAGITRIVLSPGEVGPASGTQLGFWGGASAADERAARAVARLEALLGPDAVQTVEPRGGRRLSAEAALVRTASVDLSDTNRPGFHRHEASEAPWPGRLPPPSATTVLSDSRPIEVLDADGHEVEVTGRGELSGLPASLCRDTRSGSDTRPGTGVAIVAWAGPWPVDERWWDDERRQRLARLQLVTEHGDALVVTRQHRRWWLTAVYD